MGGFGRVMAGIVNGFGLGGLSSLGLPATAGFVAEFMTFLGAWRSAHPWWLFPAVAGTFLTAVYILRVAKQIFWAAAAPDFPPLADARGPEWVALALLPFVPVFFGMLPAAALAPLQSGLVPVPLPIPPQAAIV